MAEAVVGFFLENVQQLLLYNAELILDSKSNVEALYKDLQWFKAYLRDASEKHVDSNLLQVLVDDIRSVVHKAEDIIDKYVVERATFKSRGPVGRARHAVGHVASKRSIGREIESIREEVRGIYEKQQSGFKELHLSGLPERSSAEKKSPVVEEEDVVGFDGEAEAVINRLTGEDKDLDVMTIIGMPGLGKTTLARKVYTDPKIEYEFFTRAWVYVSQNCSRKEVFLSILRIFDEGKDYSSQSDATIVEELRKYLENGKYLIVLDDVWTTQDWDDLKAVFPNKKKGSRILITSRHRDVSTYANCNKPPHDLKFLTDEESQELLEKKVFGKKGCPEGELKALANQIAKKCEGLPLAIVVIAGILLNNREVTDWWQQVASNVSTFIVKDQKKFMDVVSMSYNHLPYHLKSCFLYLGVFPEDYEIPAWKLIHLWIAEGFVEQDGERSLEDIAEACVVDLVNRNLLMAVKRRSNGQVKTCRVHDILYDFCKKEAEKQNFYQEIKNPNQDNSDTYRRVCIKSRVQEYLDAKPSGEHVRTFLSFPRQELALAAGHVSTIPKAFKLLRVLDIKSIVFDIFPKDVARLVLLRYLALTCNIKTLPASISQLWNMQTLIFLTSKGSLELKEDIWKLYQLRHLRTNASALLPAPPPSSTQKPRENVQSLSTISPESCTEQVFARTPNIKKLGVRGKLVQLFHVFDNLGKLEHLTNLKLFDDPFGTNNIDSLPPAYKFPKKLRKLTLSDTSLEWDKIHTLGSLEMLEVLKLKDNAFKGEIWEPADGGFLKLKILYIGNTDLKTWRASNHHFPSLKHLVLKHCEKLESVPTDFADIHSFQVLELHRSSKAVPSAKAIQDKKMASGGLKLSIYPPEN